MTAIERYRYVVAAMFVAWAVFWTIPNCEQCQRMATRVQLKRRGFTSYRLAFTCKTHAQKTITLRARSRRET